MSCAPFAKGSTGTHAKRRSNAMNSMYYVLHTRALAHGTRRSLRGHIGNPSCRRSGARQVERQRNPGPSHLQPRRGQTVFPCRPGDAKTEYSVDSVRVHAVMRRVLAAAGQRHETTRRGVRARRNNKNRAWLEGAWRRRRVCARSAGKASAVGSSAAVQRRAFIPCGVARGPVRRRKVARWSGRSWGAPPSSPFRSLERSTAREAVDGCFCRPPVLHPMGARPMAGRAGTRWHALARAGRLSAQPGPSRRVRFFSCAPSCICVPHKKNRHEQTRASRRPPPVVGGRRAPKRDQPGRCGLAMPA